MSPRAASRLESLGFREVYDYTDGKADWSAAGLPMEGEAANRPVIGALARTDAPRCRMDQPIDEVWRTVESAGWDQAVVLDGRGVLLGWLSQDTLRSETGQSVAAVMLEGPVTFRPNTSPQETARWMDGHSVESTLVTNQDGLFLGVIRRHDLDD